MWSIWSFQKLFTLECRCKMSHILRHKLCHSCRKQNNLESDDLFVRAVCNCAIDTRSRLLSYPVTKKKLLKFSKDIRVGAQNFSWNRKWKLPAIRCRILLRKRSTLEPCVKLEAIDLFSRFQFHDCIWYWWYSQHVLQVTPRVSSWSSCNPSLSCLLSTSSEI